MNKNKKTYQLFVQYFSLITRTIFCRYWYWHRIASLVVLIIFFSSLVFPIIALAQSISTDTTTSTDEPTCDVKNDLRELISKKNSFSNLPTVSPQTYNVYSTITSVDPVTGGLLGDNKINYRAKPIANTLPKIDPDLLKVISDLLTNNNVTDIANNLTKAINDREEVDEITKNIINTTQPILDDLKKNSEEGSIDSTSSFNNTELENLEQDVRDRIEHIDYSLFPEDPERTMI